MVSLQTLDVSRCDALGSVPSGIACATALRSLDLCRCFLLLEVSKAYYLTLS